jgi:hypothetical protein
MSLAKTRDVDSLENLRRSLDLAEALIEHAERGSEECRDDGCMILYGIMRDCGYKIRERARLELEGHLSGGMARDEQGGQ